MPAFQQIAKWEPATYARMKSSMLEAIRRHESMAQAQGRVRTAVAAVAKKYMATASDEALVDYMRVMLDEIRQTTEKDPNVAYAMVFDGDNAVDITHYIDDATQKHDAAALAEIIHSGVLHEASYQNDQRATSILQQVVAGLRTDYGEDADLPFNKGVRQLKKGSYTSGVDAMMAYAAMPPVDKRRTCEMTIEFYNRILGLRSDQAAKVVRLLLSKI